MRDTDVPTDIITTCGGLGKQIVLLTVDITDGCALVTKHFMNSCQRRVSNNVIFHCSAVQAVAICDLICRNLT